MVSGPCLYGKKKVPPTSIRRFFIFFFDDVCANEEDMPAPEPHSEPVEAEPTAAESSEPCASPLGSPDAGFLDSFGEVPRLL